MQAIERTGVTLDLKTQMLCHGHTVFINGDAFPIGKREYPVLRELADSRRLNSDVKWTPAISELLYEWYQDGFLTPTRRR